jgi:hypothetical protein
VCDTVSVIHLMKNHRTLNEMNQHASDVLRSPPILLSALAYYGAATMHPTNDDGKAHIAVVLIRVKSMPNGHFALRGELVMQCRCAHDLMRQSHQKAL